MNDDADTDRVNEPDDAECGLCHASRRLELADVASVTKTYFIRLFHKITGITPQEYRKQLKA